MNDVISFINEKKKILNRRLDTSPQQKWQNDIFLLLQEHIEHVNVPVWINKQGRFPLQCIDWARMVDGHPTTIISGKLEAIQYLRDRIMDLHTTIVAPSEEYPSYYDLIITR